MTNKKNTVSKTQKTQTKTKNTNTDKKARKNNNQTKTKTKAKTNTEKEPVNNVEVDDKPAPLLVNSKFDERFKALQDSMNSLNEKSQAVRSDMKKLRNDMKKLKSAYDYDVKKISKLKKRRANVKPCGFMKDRVVPKALAKYIGVEEGVELPGKLINSKVWETIRERGLQYKKDKRVLRTDAETRKLFGLKKSVDKSTVYDDKEGFNIITLQTYLAKVLNKAEAEAEANADADADADVDVDVDNDQSKNTKNTKNTKVVVRGKDSNKKK